MFSTIGTMTTSLIRAFYTPSKNNKSITLFIVVSNRKKTRINWIRLNASKWLIFINASIPGIESGDFVAPTKTTDDRRYSLRLSVNHLLCLNFITNVWNVEQLAFSAARSWVIFRIQSPFWLLICILKMKESFFFHNHFHLLCGFNLSSSFSSREIISPVALCHLIQIFAMENSYKWLNDEILILRTQRRIVKRLENFHVNAVMNYSL